MLPQGPSVAIERRRKYDLHKSEGRDLEKMVNKKVIQNTHSGKGFNIKNDSVR